MPLCHVNYLRGNFREWYENPKEFSKLLPSFSPWNLRVFENTLTLILKPTRCSHSRKFSKFENENENSREWGLVWQPYCTVGRVHLPPYKYMLLSLLSVICDFLPSSHATVVPKGWEIQSAHKIAFLDFWKFKSPALLGWESPFMPI